ncbi:hypothetical protein Q8W71_14960 [Methylobacterium sp. NEAU 140]|uniref:hypothetical protein n=1 Tax=Methylobacterium sp. NEAU 140 TaxID=3064945 RepID=UPI00273527C8|nr:hypothetical protein [Methylobacterium sp. NEAU 140]MDP4023929.1 hypothetical protein [Methylobacterium sp. NEAU 140]
MGIAPRMGAPGGAAAAPHGAAAWPGLGERLHAFRSLGGNCEFGFVQRYGGVEPSGLLRFSYTPIDDLIHALDTDFAAFGAAGDLRVEETESGAYYCRSRRYNIWSNTAQMAGSIDPAALLEREYGRVAHLKRRMLEELAGGTKILVRKAGQGETEADFARLADAVARHGASTLLRVEAAGSGWRPEPVRRLGERLLAGRVRRFAPTETAWDIDLEPWLALCDSAYAARHGIPDGVLDAGPFTPALALRGGLRRHRGRHPEPRYGAYTRTVDPSRFDPDAVYAFSAWVWIPAEANPARIAAVMGWGQLGWRDADLGLRERWQRVWAAGRIRRGAERVAIGLAMVGGRADRFWSWGAELHAGPVPRPAAPPAFRPGFRAWLPFGRG